MNFHKIWICFCNRVEFITIHLLNLYVPSYKLACSWMNWTPAWACSVIGVLESPLLGLLDGSVLVSLPGISDFLIQRIIQVWERHQGLDGEEDGPDLESGRPLVLQDIKADAAELVDVGVVDLCSEEHLWWDHWVLIRKEEFAVEDATLVWSFGWTCDLHEEVSRVLFVWLSVDTNDWVLGESLSFLSITNTFNTIAKYRSYLPWEFLVELPFWLQKFKWYHSNNNHVFVRRFKS